MATTANKTVQKETVPQEIETFREKVRAVEPPFLGLPMLQPITLVSVIILTWAVSWINIHDSTWQDWVAFPITWIGGSLFEYWFHRFPLHRRSKPIELVYDIHTKMHHVYYQWPHIVMPSMYDIRSILFPWWAIFVHVILTGTLCRFILYPLVGWNFAWITFGAGSAYFGFYEIIHMTCHLPKNHWFARLPILSWLRRHHGLHHIPSIMQTRNFNVVLPLGDFLFRTVTTKEP